MRHRNDQFEEIYKLIKNYDNDDAIIQTMKLKEISKHVTKCVSDEKILSDLFDFLNTKALQDDVLVTKFASVVSSRQLDAFIINGKTVRHAMLEILQKNFQNGTNFKRDDMTKFYNSIKLLGEYFNKARTSNGTPINIIGQSLLNLLNLELEKELKNLIHFKTDVFGELIMTQFALNGNLLKTRHKTEIELVLINIRKCLIEINLLSSKTKAYLLMTLDLYYANFNESNMEKQLEKIYQIHLLDNSTDATKIIAKNNESSPPTAPVATEPVSRSQSQSGRVSDRPTKTQLNGKLSRQTISHGNGRPTHNNDRRSERSVPPKSPVKTYPPRPLQTRRPEPASYRPNTPTNNSHHYQQKPTSPQKKISPKELRTRQNNKTPPASQQCSKPPSMKIESAIDKLQIKSSSDTNKSSNQQQQQETPPISPTHVQVTNSDENILKQQNTNGSSLGKSKAASASSKVYFKEENVENLSWNGETSFEFDDPELGSSDAQSPKPNQYSSSFLNFLSNN